MEYRLLQHNQSNDVFAVREDGMARGPLKNNEFRDQDTPTATIRVDWAGDQTYVLHRPELWESDEYTMLASDRDPLSAMTDQPEALHDPE